METMTTMARTESSYGAEKLSPRQKNMDFRCGNPLPEAKKRLFRCGNRHFGAKSLLFRCGEAPPEARNSDLRHGNRDSSINFMKRVPLSGQKV